MNKLLPINVRSSMECGMVESGSIIAMLLIKGWVGDFWRRHEEEVERQRLEIKAITVS